MKITYKKANGDISDRDLIVLSKPSSSYFTIDITDLPREETAKIHAALDSVAAFRKEVLEDFGIKYRRFLEENIIGYG